jgi:hypothetical protein
VADVSSRCLPPALPPCLPLDARQRHHIRETGIPRGDGLVATELSREVIDLPALVPVLEGEEEGGREGGREEGKGKCVRLIQVIDLPALVPVLEEGREGGREGGKDMCEMLSNS